MGRLFHRESRTNEETASFLRNCTLPQILLKQAEALGRGGPPAIREKAWGVWQAVDWKSYRDYVEKVALGLKSLGFRRKDTAGLIVDNGPEWLFSNWPSRPWAV